MAHLKVFSPSGWTFDLPIVQRIKIASTGLRGEDRKEFIKRAGDTSNIFLPMIEQIKMASGEEPVHVIASGATERWGANRNGDGFDRANSKARHDTFVKHAKWYRGHCFVAGTPIVTADRRRKPIEDIKLGDLVATMDGAKPVTQLMVEDYEGPGVELEMAGVPLPVRVTSEHPIYVLRREQVHCRHRYSRLGHGKSHGLRCKEWRAGLNNLVPQYVPADQLREGDYALIPKPSHGQKSVPEAFAKYIGWIASEGHVARVRDRGCDVSFTFSAENVTDIATVQRVVRALGMDCGRVDRADGLVQLWVRSNGTKWNRLVPKYVRGVKNKKRVTGKILDWDTAALLAFLSAYIEGDGSVARRGRKAGQLRIRSSSRPMLDILSDIVRALDLPATVNYDGKAGPMRSPRNPKTYWGNGSGVVSVAGTYSNVLTHTTRKKFNRARKPIMPMALGALYLAKIVSVREIEIAEKVYNFEVAGPHHYVANECVVHNCNKNPQKSYGIIKASAYHPTMDRIELICGLNRTKEAADRNGGLIADKEMEKLERGESIPTSMACKVAYDVCSYCGNKARNRDEYCTGSMCKAGGCANHLGEIVKVGGDLHHLHVNNPNQTYCDISSVFRNADPTSFGDRADWLEKAAEDGYFAGCATDIGRALDLRAPRAVVLEQAGFVEDPWIGCNIKLAHGLDALEVVRPGSREFIRAFDSRVLSKIAFEKFPLFEGEKVASILNAFAENMIILPLHEFAELTKRADYVDVARNALPGIYGRMLDNPDFDVMIQRCPYAVPTERATRHVKMAQEYVSSHALVPEAVQNRCAKSYLRGLSLPTTTGDFQKAASVSGTGADLARDYAIYKLTGLTKIASFVSGDAYLLTCQLALCQNQAV